MVNMERGTQKPLPRIKPVGYNEKDGIQIDGFRNAMRPVSSS